MIQVKNLRIDYDEFTAVNEISFEVKEGQIFGLVGPNGAGKTSTIKAMAGILEPTYGEIYLNNFDIDLNRETALQQLGYMPDFPPVYEHLLVWEYLDVFALAYKIESPEKERIIEHWLKRIKLQDKKNSVIRTLSRGMRQRLVLAKTLLHDPKILLLDEPASGLDPIGRKDMADILKEVASEGKTIIISSHILKELTDFCNSIGIMEKGKMIAAGSLNEIQEQFVITKTLTIKLTDTNDMDNQTFLNILNDFLQIESANQSHKNQFDLKFKGTQADAQVLLKTLINKDIPICGFEFKENSLEDIFFKISKGEVS